MPHKFRKRFCIFKSCMHILWFNPTYKLSLLCGFMIPLLRIPCADELLSQLEVQGNLEKLKELWSAQGVLLQPLRRGGEREAGP